ncbi:MAG TPA: ABC transporter permease [Candidatus Limnocylindrales bacterium]|nr:ABC transporter permease [Candidatus Limnocylindrales bacterium]
MTALTSGSHRLQATVQATAAYLRLEVPRTLRNRRLLMLTVVFPVAFYLLFTRVLTGGVQFGNDERAFVMVSMAAYGAIGATLSAAVRVAMERTSGWTRQLRVTPMPALGYVTTKLVTAYLAAIPAIVLVMLAALTANQVTLPPFTWLSIFVALSLGALPFAALGVAIGYVFDESTAQLVFTISFVGLAVLGGLWAPISTFPEGLATMARMLPSFHFANLGWSALAGGGPDASDALALLAYGLVFVAIVAWRYRVGEQLGR